MQERHTKSRKLTHVDVGVGSGVLVRAVAAGDAPTGAEAVCPLGGPGADGEDLRALELLEDLDLVIEEGRVLVVEAVKRVVTDEILSCRVPLGPEKRNTYVCASRVSL